ncbi:hypothetical protein [Pseudonocardia lacus]|uniref:hypothetical protein n=1 Tax=Pseudonocardia lacus TaxID=2835865 RepID=UPI001BDC4800|nr:hypothetical protein [Pseudonocardia lacus]
MAEILAKLEDVLPTIVVARTVAVRFTEEIQKHPGVEVGGKFIGLIRGPARHSDVQARIDSLGELTFQVTDYLDDGPRAQRTPTYHLGDAQWQTTEFRKRELADPRIEQIGSWHSHHPNGLDRLSNGDVRGYQDTVDDPGHNHDFFIASLGVDFDGFATAKHYLFVRGSRNHWRLPPGCVRVQDFLPASEQGKNAEHRAVDELSQPDVGGPVSRSEPAPPEQRTEAAPPKAVPTGDGGRAVGEASSKVRVPGWSDSEVGRRALAQQQLLLSEKGFAQVRLGSSDGRLLASGWIPTKIGRVSLSLVYPSVPGGDDGLLKLVTTDTGATVDLAMSGSAAWGLAELRPALHQFVELVTQQYTPPQRPTSRWMRRWS